MPRRPLPSAAEAAEILAAKRTRPPRRAPPPVGRRLSKFIKDLDERFGQGPEALKARWREIAGEPLANHTEPSKLSRPRGGGGAVLELKVEGPAAVLVQHQSRELLERVNLFLGAGAVERLRIVQGHIARSDKPAPATARPRRPPPLDAAMEAQLQAGVPDGPLKNSLVRLGREVMRRNPETPL